MSARRMYFNNLNDGVDWANELPPHIVAQQQQQRMRQQQREREIRRTVSRPMFVGWPLEEDSFPIPPLILRQREAQAPPPARRGHASTVNALAQAHHPVERRRPDAMNALISAQLRAMEEMSALMFADRMQSAVGMPDLAQVLRLFEAETRAPATTTRVMMVRSSAQRPQMTIMRVEEHRNGSSGGTRTVTHVRRNINRSGADFDIITGGSRGPSAAPAADNSEWELSDMSYERLLELDRGTEPTGLQQRQLRGMKTQPHKGPSVTCAICLEDVKQGAMTLDLRCGHKFHHACMTRWLAQRNCCPTCRCEIPRLGQTR